MDLRAIVEVVDNDDDPVSQEPAHITPHSPVCASDEDDDDAGATSEMAPPLPNTNTEEVVSLPRDTPLHRKQALSVVNKERCCLKWA